MIRRNLRSHEQYYHRLKRLTTVFGIRLGASWVSQSWSKTVANGELDNKAAIMIVIEHLGDVQPGQKCSAVFFDREKIQREKEFHAKLYSQNGVHDPDILHAMVEANVPGNPYWLVSVSYTHLTLPTIYSV